MPSYQPVSFQSPGFDYGADLNQIERRRAMAAMLQKEGLSQEPQQQVAPGQFAVPYSPFQGAAKMAQILAGKRQEQKADTQQRNLASTAQSNLASVLMNAQKAASGTPATALSEDASGNVTPAQPAVAGDPMKAASMYMQHPMTAQLGQSLAQGEISQQQRQRMLASILQPQGAAPSPAPSSAAGGSAPAYGSPGFSPQGAAPPQQPQGAPNPLAGVPPQVVAMLTSGDAELQKLGTTIMEANKGVAQRPGAPVVNPFTGAVIAQAPPSVPAGMQLDRGPQGWSASPVTGFAGAQEQLRSIPDPSHGLIPIKTSSGQDIQLTQPEYLQWQKTQQLPPRLGGPAVQTGQGGIPNLAQQAGALAQRPQGGFRVSGAPGLGVIGAGQTQEDTVRQQAQLASNTEASKEFISEMRQNYAKLRDVPATINNINRAKDLAAGEAAQFMGPLGESKLALQKFFRTNVPGMGNLNLEGVTKAEELQSSLFNQVMDNLKKMDASPSQYQQQVMQEAFGTLRTDPASLPKIMDVFEDILRNRVALHNETVGSAEKRGTQFPYDVNVKLPAKKGQPLSAAEREELKRLEQQVGNGRR